MKFFCRFPTIFFAPAGSKMSPKKYEVSVNYVLAKILSFIIGNGKPFSALLAPPARHFAAILNCKLGKKRVQNLWVLILNFCFIRKGRPWGQRLHLLPEERSHQFTGHAGGAQEEEEEDEEGWQQAGALRPPAGAWGATPTYGAEPTNQPIKNELNCFPLFKWTNRCSEARQRRPLWAACYCDNSGKWRWWPGLKPIEWGGGQWSVRLWGFLLLSLSVGSDFSFVL